MVKAGDIPYIIYGLFNERGECIYVGKTRNAKSRFCGHIGARGKFKGQKISMAILRRTTAKHSNRIEREMGLMFKANGQAIYSTQFPKCSFNSYQNDFPTREQLILNKLANLDWKKTDSELASLSGLTMSRVRNYRIRNNIMPSPQKGKHTGTVPRTVSAYMRLIGSKGGKNGSRKDKIRAANIRWQNKQKKSLTLRAA